MRFGCCAILALSACYAPQVVGGAPCDPSRDSCPTGQTCQPVGSGNYCMAEGARGGDAGVDAPPLTNDGGTCLGKGVLGSVCLSGAAPAPVSLTTVTINTESTTAGNCREIRAQASGPSLCLITGTTINVAAGVTVRAVGANPLVLVATQSITINGTIDVSTHSNETIGGAAVLGAGARTAAGCAAIGLDGLAGQFVNNNDYGGGGAAGGSFGSIGGAGGFGGNNSNTGHGNPVLGTVPGVLIGGCPGGHGGDGSGGGGGALGGNGGGAMYLLAGDSITVMGTINASGSGGAGGNPGMFSSGGGGGGGAGGMIGVEATRITVAGSLFANGGGGGSGGGSQPTNTGLPGADPTQPTSAALGGAGNNGGGNGGNGSVAAQAGLAGKAGSNNTYSAGGGGGGGAGVIRVIGVPPASTGGTVSPPAT